VCACVCVFLAVMLGVCVFMCAYLGTIFIFKYVLLKFIFSLQCLDLQRPIWGHRLNKKGNTRLYFWKSVLRRRNTFIWPVIGTISGFLRTRCWTRMINKREKFLELWLTVSFERSNLPFGIKYLYIGDAFLQVSDCTIIWLEHSNSKIGRIKKLENLQAGAI
jgi:hypothetical protein